MKKVIALLIVGFQIVLAPVSAIHYGTDPVREEGDIEEELFLG